MKNPKISFLMSVEKFNKKKKTFSLPMKSLPFCEQLRTTESWFWIVIFRSVALFAWNCALLRFYWMDEFFSQDGTVTLLKKGKRKTYFPPPIEKIRADQWSMTTTNQLPTFMSANKISELHHSEPPKAIIVSLNCYSSTLVIYRFWSIFFILFAILKVSFREAWQKTH